MLRAHHAGVLLRLLQALSHIQASPRKGLTCCLCCTAASDGSFRKADRRDHTLTWANPDENKVPAHSDGQGVWNPVLPPAEQITHQQDSREGSED